MNVDKNIMIYIKIDNPGNVLVKHEKYIFNDITNTYQVLFNVNEINDKYIKPITNTKYNLHLPMKKNGNVYTIVISVNLNGKKDDILECNFHSKIQ